jgi:hypothetical protein|tara:strand:- start:30 stop:545 length:516 start_codon:yes stop_codon:yes gene_type:complete
VKSNYTIKDNFLSDKDFRSLSDVMLGADIPWYYNPYRVREGDGEYQFTHTFYRFNTIYSNWFHNLNKIIEEIKPASLLKIKANLTPKEHETVVSGFHNDGEDTWGIREGEEGWLTSVFYLNTSNGYTLLDDGTKVKSVANRLASFPQYVRHASASCTDEKIRVVLNLNYIL